MKSRDKRLVVPAVALSLVNVGLVVWALSSGGKQQPAGPRGRPESLTALLLCVSPLALAGHLAWSQDQVEQDTQEEKDGKDDDDKENEQRAKEAESVASSAAASQRKRFNCTSILKSCAPGNLLQAKSAIQEEDDEGQDEQAEAFQEINGGGIVRSNLFSAKSCLDSDEDFPSLSDESTLAPTAASNPNENGDMYTTASRASIMSSCSASSSSLSSSSSPPTREWGTLSSPANGGRPSSSSLYSNLSRTPRVGSSIGLSRHLSANSMAYMDSHISDIDTPLQQALSQLFKVRAFISLLDAELAESAAAEVEEMANETREHRSETGSSSIFSPSLDGVNAARSNGAAASASPKFSPKLASRQNSNSGGGGGSPSFRALRKRFKSPSLDTAVEDKALLPSTDNKYEPQQQQQGTGDNAAGGLSETLREPLNPPDSLVGVPVRKTRSSSATRPIPLTNLSRHDSGMSYMSSDFHSDSEGAPMAGFSPLQALDVAIEALMEPEKLMKPILRGGGDSVGHVAWNGTGDPWLNVVGATREQSSQMHADVPGELPLMKKVKRRSGAHRQRLNSDQLAHILVDKSGKMVVKSPSVDNLSGMSGGASTSGPEAWDFEPALTPQLRRVSSAADGASEKNVAPSAAGTTPSPLPIITTMHHSLGHLNDWNFDAFKFAEETEQRPLYTILWAVFTSHNYFKVFDIDRAKFKSFCKELEAGYLPLPYHSSSHAADVLVGMHYLLFNLDLGTLLTPLESMSAMISAAIHDYKHPGRTNALLIKIKHPLSILYNDQSVLEQMHLAEAFRLLNTPGYDIFQGLNPEQWGRFRKLTIRTVLATDLKDHFETVTKLRNFAKRRSSFVVPANKEIILEVSIKVADIGHAGKDFALHVKWANLIQEEFFMQGDQEKELSLPVSEFMDRQKVECERNQSGFFKCIALPLFQSVRGVHPPFQSIERQCRRNLAEWQRRLEKKQTGGIGSSSETL